MQNLRRTLKGCSRDFPVRGAPHALKHGIRWKPKRPPPFTAHAAGSVRHAEAVVKSYPRKRGENVNLSRGRRAGQPGASTRGPAGLKMQAAGAWQPRHCCRRETAWASLFLESDFRDGALSSALIPAPEGMDAWRDCETGDGSGRSVADLAPRPPEAVPSEAERRQRSGEQRISCRAEPFDTSRVPWPIRKKQTGA